MIAVNGLGEKFAFSARKKLGHSGTFGFRRHGDLRFGNASRLDGVYQTRHKNGVSETVRMRYYRPINPASIPQEANRAKFAAAMTAWHALTTEQKAVYTTRAKKRGLFGRNLFIREYYQSS